MMKAGKSHAFSPSPPPAAGEGRGPLRSNGKGEGVATQKRSMALRKNPTEAEKLLGSKIRNRQICGLKFRRQYPVGNYIPDFVCFDPKVIVEVDGGQHNESPHDEQRDAWFRTQGFEVFRFWNNDVLENVEGVVHRLGEALASRPPHPSHAAHGPLPSPAASGGEGEKAGDKNA